jgi:hypothetical protein
MFFSCDIPQQVLPENFNDFPEVDETTDIQNTLQAMDLM